MVFDISMTIALNDIAFRVSWIGIFFIACATWLIWVLAALTAVAVAKSWLNVGKKILVGALGGGGLFLGASLLLHSIFPRLRPFVDHAVIPLVHKSVDDPSFPSEHAGMAFALATALFLYDKRLGALAYVLAALVAVGRVAVGVHYSSDVAGGALLGIASALVVNGIITKTRIANLL